MRGKPRRSGARVRHAYRFARALASNDVAHTVHVFAHGPHSLGLARGPGDAAIWTTLAASWIAERVGEALLERDA